MQIKFDDAFAAKAFYHALKFIQMQPDIIRAGLHEDEEDIKGVLLSKGINDYTSALIEHDTIMMNELSRKTPDDRGNRAEFNDQIRFYNPPDLNHFRFIQDGDAPTPPFEFIDEGETKPHAPDHDKNRRDLGATIQGTLDAFRESK